MMRRKEMLALGALGGLTLLLLGRGAPGRGAAAAVAAPDAGVQASAGAAGPEDAGLAAPDALSPLARVLLHGRMQRHRDDMGALLKAVLLLQRERIVEVASLVASEPSLSKPGDGSDTFNAVLPPRFFALEAQLHAQAGALAEAARTGEVDQALAYRFGQLTETCVSCHQAYQQPAGAPPR